MPGTNQPQHGIQGLAAKLQEFTRRLTSLESWQRTMSVPASAWIAPTLLNSWAAATAVGYFQDPLGFVHLRGSMTGGTSNTLAFTLPAGFRVGTSDFWPMLQGSGVAGAFVHIGS